MSHHVFSRAAAAAAALALVGCGSSGDSAASTSGGSSGTSATGSSSTAGSSSTGGTPPSSTPAAASSCVKKVRSAMTPTQRAGQLVMAALEPGPADGLDRYVSEQGLGGMLYLGGWEGADTVTATSRHMQQVAPTVDGTKVGTLVAADQEGGEVQQLSGSGFTDIPSGLEQSRLPQLRSSAKTWGSELADAGVNINLAPVADTVPADIGTDNEPIGKWDRQYGSTPRTVGKGASSFARGMIDAGVEPTVKHFPGIGRIKGNTDLTDENISDRRMTRGDTHLHPFAKTIDAGAKIVMVGSAHYPKIDGDTPAVFSRTIVTGMLRGDLGFDRVVVTDDVGAAKSVAATPVGQRATKFVAAGGDIVLTAEPGQVPTMVEALQAKGAKHPAFAKKLNASVTRVLTLKEDMGLLRCG
ncbi:glycoside hydrolase family 3 N-terminal domain-containing protein [Janibacter corallicola]|uniref:glycoside hydrolase family 3 N-terminal domain-containing protein n=1 Tax=Janibacter corallicola TaxID=415212 RepID=UPI000A8F7DB2|nr:glycoside hydrolase family 3 N-terminal domain-containing protein [Janibacter corallicola]